MDKMKIFITAAFAAITTQLGILAIPIYILVTTNIIDYFTGLLAAKYRGQKISSYIGIRGIAKKICMWLLVIVGALVDELIFYATNIIGLEIPITFIVGSFVAIWLICNEIISILENIGDMDVKTPAFLQRAIELVKSKVEEKNE